VLPLGGADARARGYAGAVEIRNDEHEDHHEEYPSAYVAALIAARECDRPGDRERDERADGELTVFDQQPDEC